MVLAFNNLYNTEIWCADKCTIDTSMSITVTLKDTQSGNVTGRKNDVYIVTPNGVKSLLTSTNYASTVTVNYTPSEWGLYTIICNHTKKQFLVTGWKQYNINGSFLILYYNETKVILRIYTDGLTGTNSNWVVQGTIPNEYSFLRPEIPAFVSSYTTKGEWAVDTDGVIRFRRWANTTGGEYNTITWARKDV